MKHSPFVFFALALLLALPLSAIARNLDATFRLCMQQATSAREQRNVNAARAYHGGWQALLEERARRLSDSWGIEDDTARGREQWAIEKEINQRQRALEKMYQHEVRAAQTDFQSAERACRNGYQSRLKSVPVGKVCQGSAECSPPLGICTTELGECSSLCKKPTDVCIAVCVGKCRFR